MGERGRGSGKGRSRGCRDWREGKRRRKGREREEGKLSGMEGENESYAGMLEGRERDRKKKIEEIDRQIDG